MIWSVYESIRRKQTTSNGGVYHRLHSRKQRRVAEIRRNSELHEYEQIGPIVI